MSDTRKAIHTRRQAKHSDCPAFKVYFRLTAEQRLQAFFLKKNLPSEVIRQQFGKGLFEMLTTIDLPMVVLGKLGIESYKINPGIYPVQEDQHFIKIDF